MKLSTNLDSTLKSRRAKQILIDVAQQNKRLMPCGDQRYAALLFRFGAIRVVNAKDRRFTTSYEATELGLSKLNLGDSND